MPIFERTELDGNTFQLQITLQPEDYYPKFEEELKKFKKNAAIKGFRKGQAPISYLKKVYGKEMYPRLIIETVSTELENYVRDNNVRVVGQPLGSEDKPGELNFDLSKTDQTQSVFYDIGYVKEFEVQGLDNRLTIEQWVVNDLDELAVKELEDMRRRGGKRTNPTDNIQDRDLLTIASVEVDEDNAPVDGGWATDITIYVDSIKDEAFKAEILASKQDDIIFFNARKVEDFEKETMYRKYFLKIPDGDDRVVQDTFRGEITNISRMELSELDAEFFQQNFGEEVENKEAALEKLKPAIDFYYKDQTHHVLRRSAKNALLEVNNIDLPENMLRRWVKAVKPGTTDETVAGVEGLLFEDFRWSMLQSKLQESMDIVVTEDELRQMARAQLSSYFQGQSFPEDFLQTMTQQMLTEAKSRQDLTRQVENNKFYMELLNKFTIQEIPMSSTELKSKLEEVTAENKAYNKKSEELSALLSE